MQVYAGNFVVDGDPTAYERQRDAIKNAITTYGADHVAGVTVGNEFMLKLLALLSFKLIRLKLTPLSSYLTAHNSKDPNSATGNEGY
jgi:hypothetical protein